MRATFVIFTLAAYVAGWSAASAQQPDSATIKKAFATCQQHRYQPRADPQSPTFDQKFRTPPDPRNKDWQAGWEFCSDVQDAFEPIEQAEAAVRLDAERSAAVGIAGQLKK